MNLLEELSRMAPGRPRDLGVLSPAEAARLDDLLGDGDIAVSLGAGIEVRESVFPGIWRLRGVTGTVVRHGVEVAEVPAAVTRCCREVLRDAPDRRPAPETALTAPLLLDEIAASLKEGGERVISLTNLPINADDLAHLDACLGHGAIHGEAAGHGVCRFAATGVHRVWRVRYFNADDKLLIDSIEVGDLPVAAKAQPEDVADGLAGLARLLAMETQGGQHA